MLSELNLPLYIPIPKDMENLTFKFENLYDLAMALQKKKALVGNKLDAKDKSLFIITGANQGGKSTYLRSIGLSQILMQCGLFVPAEYFCASICRSVFTHFTREEDIAMKSGRLDEELCRMNTIINNISKYSLLLMNESFTTTTEREASGIAIDIIKALYESKIKVMFVTHLYEFASMVYKMNISKAIFLRAQRDDDGNRSFVIDVGEPLQTSYGEDLFRSIIGI